MTRRDRSSDRLLMRSDQLELMDRSLEQQAIERERDDVDDARRAKYLERLRAALPELRKIEGFPIGTDEDILALSDPPYYTACPNPFLAEFIAEHGTPYDEATDDYHREPFAADVSEGKNDPIYTAHSYHTKVPHKAIMRYILHYTKPGDIVFDGFCGTGMTGVAAQLCGSPDSDFKATVEAEWAAAVHQKPEWGARYAVLGDLSPVATFIAYNYNTPVEVGAFDREAMRILDQLDDELGWMYETTQTDGSPARINFVVWSDVLQCPSCGAEESYWILAADESTGTLRSELTCGSCSYVGRKESYQPAYTSVVDALTGETRQVRKREPGRIDLIRSMGRTARRHEPLTGYAGGPVWAMQWGDMHRAGYHRGMTHLHHFFTPRNWAMLVRMRDAARAIGVRRRSFAHLFAFTGTVQIASLMSQFRFDSRKVGNTAGGIMKGALYIPSLPKEAYVPDLARRRYRAVSQAFAALGQDRSPSYVSTQSATDLHNLPGESIDFVFVDPPFGANIMYAELNELWEPWLGVVTDRAQEAIENQDQRKGLVEYRELMVRSFEQCYWVLKPGRWMTVAFHNSNNAVWNAIQEAIQRARFVVADVRVLDKQQASIKQASTAGAVKQDLVISAYKPRAGFEQRFALEAGTEQGAWHFIREHLGLLPVFVDHDGRVEVVAERQNYLLYDRMVAFHIQRGATVPLSAGHFYEGLHQRFLERDDMYFTELQAADYDRRRLDAREVEQLSVFVVDEKSAIQWIRAELLAQPQTFQDLQPKFLRELNQNRFEELPELRDILDQNFLEDPSSHRWRVPDPGKQADLEALRIRALLNEFGTYMPGTAKLKRFRLEAIRAGLADLWAKRDYRAIISLAERLPDEIVQEDPALLMYYDNAVTREGTG
jgi:hypothetical protein